MVREIPCNARALGFSGVHHIKHVVGEFLTQQDFRMEWTKGIPLHMSVLQRVWRVSSFFSPLKVSPRACEPSKELFTLPFYFLFFCVCLWTSAVFFSATPLPILNPSFSTWLELSAFLPPQGALGCQKTRAVFSVGCAWTIQVVSH